MPKRRIISELAAMPVDEVRAELEAVQAEKVKLEMEEQLLSQMLRLREWGSNGVPGATETVAALEAGAPGHKKQNVSANVLAIVEQADRPLLPADVRDRLATNGVDAEPNAIRVALRRWVDRKRLEKRGRHYAPASPQWE
jgi:hypothetical protein